MVLTPRRPRTGFTLIEILVALAVAAIVGALGFAFLKDFGKGIREGWQRNSRRQQEVAWIGSLERGLLEGRGLLEVSARSVAFISRGNQEMRLEKTEADTVLWKGKETPIPITDLEILVQGPDCGNDAHVEETECRAIMDTLDANRDGLLDVDELDRNRDGMVNGRECRWVRWIEIRWRAGPDIPWRAVVLHPRLRLEAPLENREF